MWYGAGPVVCYVLHGVLVLIRLGYGLRLDDLADEKKRDNDIYK